MQYKKNILKAVEKNTDAMYNIETEGNWIQEVPYSRKLGITEGIQNRIQMELLMEFLELLSLLTFLLFDNGMRPKFLLVNVNVSLI